MKIIDAHTHFPGKRLGAAPRPIGELRADFEAEGLSGAWIMTTDGLILDPNPHNDILAMETAPHRDFFVPFCTVSPHQGAETAIRELERCSRDLGMRGLKFHPWLQAFSLTNPAVVPILRRAGELGLPVLFHDGTPPYCTPLQIAWAAEQAPETTIILGHSGLDDLYQDAILACLRHPNIHLCLCSLSSGMIGEILRRCPPERLLYGSDGGFGARVIRPAIAKIAAVTEDQSLLRAIFHENPQRILPLRESCQP